jgi:AcrR family transcriptional regulator
MAESLTEPRPIRERRRLAARQALLDAYVELALEGGPEAITFARLAARADVSERTVFRHFASRAELDDAFDQLLLEKMAFPGWPERLADVPAFIEDLHRRFDAQADLVTVGVQTATARLQPAQTRRLEALRAALRDDLAGLAPERAAEVVAVLDLLVSATCWHRLRHLAGLPAGSGARAAADAARAVIDRLTTTTTPQEES